MTTARGGTQSIERSIRLMRALAARARFGWRLSDLARHCEIDKGTARRILNCLVRERLAERSTGDQRYLPGPLMFELGLALPEHDEFRNAAFPALERLAIQTRTVAFLCLRSGDDVVCAARVGEVPDQAFTLNVGTRRPLSNSAAGAALLVAMPDEERQGVFERNCKALTQVGCTQAALDRLLAKSLEHKLGYNESCFVPGWNSYALALYNGTEARAAIMISAPSAHFTPAQLELSLAALRRITQELQQLSDSMFNRQRRTMVPGAAEATRRAASTAGSARAAESAAADHATP